jgi:hypothetical protein
MKARMVVKQLTIRFEIEIQVSNFVRHHGLALV